MDTAAPALPELFYVPCAEHVDTPAEARPLMRQTEDGRRLLVVYSTLEKLYAGWGDDHPWLALPPAALEALHESQRFELIGFDVELPKAA